MNVPITLYAEMTPNPATMKFVANKYLIMSEKTAEFYSVAEAKGYSPLAEELFKFPFVKSVFISSNFITVTKNESITWDYITMELREFIKNWIQEGKDILIQMPAERPQPSKENMVEQKSYAPSEFDDAIRNILDEFVRPAVENDGGAIEFRNFHEGVVTVMLKGSCAGCPSSTVTLKHGIETILKQHIVEVKEVVAENE